MSPPSLSLTDVTKNFGQTEIIRGVNMTSRPASATR